MIEIIEESTNIKMMSLIICSFKYGDNLYCVYAVKRDEENDNIFVSKLVKNSIGFAMDNNFIGGEKESLDGAINRILNKDTIKSLTENGIEILKIEPTGINKFSKDKCYVTTTKRSLIKECMQNYNLITTTAKTPVIAIKKEKIITKDKASSFFLILFGAIIIITCLIVIFTIFT